LLVEDDWKIAVALKKLVCGMGFEVVGPVPTVEQALALIGSEEIDLAALDLSLGAGQNSFPIARVLAAEGIPFLFISGYERSDFPAEFQEIPLCDKPYTYETLKHHLEALLDGGPRKAK
jgi:DNA-binding response OmpR family regulator